MSTTKTIKIQKNKILTYSINKSGFQTVNKTITVTGDTTITEEMVSTTGSKIQQLGDRLLGISTYVCDFTPSGTYDVDSLKFITASQTSGTGLTNIQVVKGTSNTEGETQTWLSKVEKELSIVTPKGTSKTFVFTYNSATWDITGDLTLSSQNIADYGITFTGTPINGDIITVVETQYNKFAVYVLDSNYRGDFSWGPNNVQAMPMTYNQSTVMSAPESATYYFDYLINNKDVNNYPIFNYCKNLGKFILPNGIKINAVIPTGYELKTIWDNRVFLDSQDPIIQAGETNYNLTSWAFGYGWCNTCQERSAERAILLSGSGAFSDAYTDRPKQYGYGCAPVFEVPVM